MIYLYPIISGIILLISFNCSGFWFLSFFALVPFFYFLYQNLSPKKVFWAGYILGFIFISGTISWFLRAYPLDWAGVENKFLGALLVFLVWFISSLVLSLFIALWSVVFYKIKTGKLRDIFLFSLLWVVFEYLRALGFSVFWAGPGALIGAHWSFGFLGYALAGNKFFLQFAGIGGVYILSFLIVFINGIFYHIFILFKDSSFDRKKFFLLTSPLLVIIICLIIFGVRLNNDHYPNNRYFKVAVIHTNFPNFFTITWKDFSKRLLAMANLLRKEEEGKIEPDIIIFPEDSRFLAYYTNPQYNEFLKNVFEGKEKLVIDSARLDEGGNAKSVLSFFNTKTGENQNYKKMLLMFNGEYLPYIVSFTGRLIGQGGWVDNFNNFRSYTKGEEITLGEFDGIKLGALFCSEIVSPELYRSITKKGADVLINIASDAAFHNSSLLVKQMLDTAKVRAVENNRYFIQAGNSGPSFIIDNKGRVVMFSDNPGAEILYGEVRAIGDKSVYDSL